LEAYRGAAEGFSRSGFLIQAIAVSKIILRIDPLPNQIQDRLATLYPREWRWGRAEEQTPPSVIPLFRI
jgi:hypothetical protein